MRAPKQVRDYCHAPRSLAEEEKQELINEKYAYECVLCYVTDYSVCNKCFFSWKPSYVDGGGISREDIQSWMKVGEEGQVVCALCVVDRERGLNIEDRLGPAERKVADRVRACLQVYGYPSIDIISIQSLGVLSGQ